MRKLLGDVRLVPSGEELWVEYDVQPAALLRGAYGQVVAGARFGNCLLTLPRTRRKPV